MDAKGGSRRGGVSRPDPEQAGWELRPWAELALEVFDGLYEPAGRPPLRELGAKATISFGYLSDFLSGKRRVEERVFRSLVRALDDKASVEEWAWRWRAAEAAHQAAAEGRPYRPLPGRPAAAEAAPPEPEPVPEWPPPRYLPHRLVWALLRWVRAALFLPARRRRDAYKQRQIRRMAQSVLNNAQQVIERAEAVHYLRPRFTLLVKPPAAGRKRRAWRSPLIPKPTAETSIRVLFGKSGEDLAVVGRPGLGKSTQLAHLARSLAQEVIDDPSRPIPVLLDLATYRGEPLEDWLVTAMKEDNDVPAALTRAWLDKVCLLPILDGLDQVPEEHRPRCASELRRFRGARRGLAFGCRTDDADLRRLAQSVNATLTVQITEPTGNDVEEYLNKDTYALRDVHAALSHNQDLWPLLQSPLMLSVIALTYRHRPATELHDTTLTPEDRRSRIFDAYIRRMLDDDRRRRDDTDEQILTWLTWLARMLSGRNERVLYLDRLDLTWLTPRQQLLPRAIPNTVQAISGLGLVLLWLAVAVRTGIVHTSLTGAAVMAGAMAGVTATQALLYEGHNIEAEHRKQRRFAPIVSNAPFIVLGGAAFGYFQVDPTAPGVILIGLAYLWLWLTAVEGHFGDLFSPVEQLRWTWRAREYVLFSSRTNTLARTMISLGVGVAHLILFGYVLHLLAPRPSWVAPAAISVLTVLYAAGSLFEPSLEDHRPRPNEGIRRTLRFSLTQGVLNFLAVAAVLLTLLAFASTARPTAAGLTAVLLAALYALSRAFRYGGLALLQHWTIRAVLAASGATPYRYRQFLHDAEQSILLHRTTSGFSFPHGLLQSHMATDHHALLARMNPARCQTQREEAATSSR